MRQRGGGQAVGVEDSCPLQPRPSTAGGCGGALGAPEDDPGFLWLQAPDVQRVMGARGRGQGVTHLLPNDAPMDQGDVAHTPPFPPYWKPKEK